jgi:hypothetical protein
MERWMSPVPGGISTTRISRGFLQTNGILGPKFDLQKENKMTSIVKKN